MSSTPQAASSPHPRTPVRAIKLYGERNSGTNYLQQLLAANLELPQLRGTTPSWFDLPFFNAEWSRDLYFRWTLATNLGWKHMHVPAELHVPSDTLVLCLTKNPYAWLVSMYRKPHHAKRRYASFDEFLQSPWHTLGRELLPVTVASPMALWNLKNSAYLRLQETHGAHLLPYERLLRDPEAALRALAQMHALALRSTFVNITQSTTHDRPERDHAFLRDHYLKEHWRSELQAEQLAVIDAALDHTLASRLGYTRIAP